MTLKTLIILGTLTVFYSCSGQGQNSTHKGTQKTSSSLVGDTVYQIDGEIRGIFQDSKNNIWFASNENGVYKFDGKTIINYTEKHGLTSNYVWMVTEGKDGKIWFRTHIRSKDEIEMCCFNGSEFKTIKADTNVKNYDFKKGELLFDYYYDGKLLSKIQLPHTSLIEVGPPRFRYDIYATCQAKNGSIWFGTQGTGICKYDGKSYTWIENKEIIGSIRDIYEDKSGTIWVGNNGDGLFRYNSKCDRNFEKYPIEKAEQMSRVWKITADNQGNLWVATIDNGVWRINENSVTNFTTKDGLSMDNIWTVYADKQGKIWVGTEGDGVYLFDGEKFNKFKL